MGEIENKFPKNPDFDSKKFPEGFSHNPIEPIRFPTFFRKN